MLHAMEGDSDAAFQFLSDLQNMVIKKNCDIDCAIVFWKNG